MKILILPTLIMLLPNVILFLFLKFGIKNLKIPNYLYVILGFLFILMGFFICFYSINLSIQGMKEKGILCMTGIGVFIPMSVFFYFVGIPLNLYFHAKRN